MVSISSKNISCIINLPKRGLYMIYRTLRVIHEYSISIRIKTGPILIHIFQVYFESAVIEYVRTLRLRGVCRSVFERIRARIFSFSRSVRRQKVWNSGSVHINPLSKENGAVLVWIWLSSTLQRRKRSPVTLKQKSTDHIDEEVPLEILKTLKLPQLSFFLLC